MHRALTVGFALVLTATTARAQQPEPARQPVHKFPPTKTTAPSDAATPAHENHFDSGSLRVPSNEWDFGHVAQDARVTHRFEVENAGKDTLYIRKIKPTCGCTSAPLVKNELAPGETMPVDVTFSTRKYNGKVHKMVHILSSDPEHPSFPLEFTAEVGEPPSTMGVQPAAVDFDRFDPSTPQEAVVELSNYTPTPMKVSVADPPVNYLDAKISAATIQPQDSVKLTVRTTGKPPLGHFTSSVTVQFEDAQRTKLTIPISGSTVMK